MSTPTPTLMPLSLLRSVVVTTVEGLSAPVQRRSCRNAWDAVRQDRIAAVGRAEAWRELDAAWRSADVDGRPPAVSPGRRSTPRRPRPRNAEGVVTV